MGVIKSHIRGWNNLHIFRSMSQKRANISMKFGVHKLRPNYDPGYNELML